MRNNYKVVLWNIHMNETNLKVKMIPIEKKEEQMHDIYIVSN